MRTFIVSFLLTLSLFASTIFFLIIPLFGLSYMGSEESSLYINTIVGLALFSMIYIIIYESLHITKASGTILPYFIPLIFAFIYLVESVIYQDIGSLSRRMFTFTLAFTMPSILYANYICRYDKLSEMLKNIEIIFIISSIGLIYSVPSMYMMLDYRASIGGGGNHQVISYGAAIFFGYFFINTFTNNDRYRYKFLCNKLVYIIEVILMLTNVGICVIGGGRGGLVLLIVNFILLSIVINKKLLLKILLILILLSLLIYFLASFTSLSNSIFYDMFQKGLERGFSYLNDDGSIDISQTSGRDYVYEGLYQLVESMPLFGYGFFHTYEICHKVVEQPYPHNIFLEILLQGGFLLLLIFCFFMLKLSKNIYIIIKSNNTTIYILPLITYPLIQLLFSGTYMTSSFFWFVVVYMFNNNIVKNYKHS